MPWVVLLLILAIAAAWAGRPIARGVSGRLGGPWGVAATAAVLAAAYLLIARAMNTFLARDSSLDTREPQIFLLYWAIVFGLLAAAYHARNRSAPGVWQRLRDRLNVPPATLPQLRRRVALIAVAVFAAGCFGDWAARGEMPLVPLHMVTAALVAGLVYGLARKAMQHGPFPLPGAAYLAPGIAYLRQWPAGGRKQVVAVLAPVGMLAVAFVGVFAVRSNPLAGLLVIVGGMVAYLVGLRAVMRWAGINPEAPFAHLDPASGRAGPGRSVRSEDINPGRDQPGRSPGPPAACPSCGSPLAADALLGLCAKCLLKVALPSEPNRTSPYTGPFVAPAAGEVQEFFPRFEILGLVGQGGMGAVYKARQRELDRVVALKLIRPKPDDPTYAERFAREAKALARLSHPNVVTVHETGEAGGSLYIVMEFVDGVTLRDAMRAKSLSPAQALDVVGQVCHALQYAHAQGVVHRDIKPENILLDKSGKVKIADFGLAKVADADGVSLTRTHQAMGTPHYMAPEQWEKPTEVDHRADMFALGVVIYEMLTGELPLGRFDPPSRKVQIDVRLDEVVLRLLEKEPARRYQQANDVWTAVDHIRSSPVPAGPRPVPRRGFEYRSRATLFGWPLLHVKTGTDPVTGRPAVAKGVIAVGDRAVGLVAIGGVAVGGLAVGGGAFGLFAVAGLAMGLFAAGGVGAGLLAGAGGVATGAVAVGGGAVGYATCGGGAIGEVPLYGTEAVRWADVDRRLEQWSAEVRGGPTHADNPWRPTPVSLFVYPRLGPAVGAGLLAVALLWVVARWLPPRTRGGVLGVGLVLALTAGMTVSMLALPLPFVLLGWLLFAPALLALVTWLNRAAARAGG